MQQNYYQILGILPTATRDDIRRAYLLHAKQHHPDRGGSTTDMQQINTAYETLGNPLLREIYDRELAADAYDASRSRFGVGHNFHTDVSEGAAFAAQFSSDGRFRTRPRARTTGKMAYVGLGIFVFVILVFAFGQNALNAASFAGRDISNGVSTGR